MTSIQALGDAPRPGGGVVQRVEPLTIGLALAAGGAVGAALYGLWKWYKGGEAPPKSYDRAELEPDGPAKQHKKHVHELTVGEGDEAETGFFKPRIRYDPTQEEGENLPDKAVALGIDPKDPHWDKREVAASVVGRHMLGDSMPDTRLATLDGKEGHFQEKASGLRGSDDPNSVSLPGLAGIRLSEGVLTPEVEKQLADLHVFDFLIGNVDRSMENYILEDGAVRPIDSELSFPSMSIDELKGVERSTLGDLPTGFSPEVLDALNSMNDEWIDHHLGSLLDEDQLRKLKERRDELKQHAKATEGMEPKAPKSYTETLYNFD